MIDICSPSVLSAVRAAIRNSRAKANVVKQAPKMFALSAVAEVVKHKPHSSVEASPVKKRVRKQNGGARLKTPEELAKLIGYHEETIRRLIREGRIRALRFGRNYRIPADEVARILAEGLPS